MSRHMRLVSFAAVATLLATALAARAATITIINLDGAGEGFNETTAATPSGGNPGTTRGQQRLNVFNQAAAIWGAILPSTVAIRVEARFDALTPCNATSGVLGSAGALQGANDFPGAELPATLYSIALANKLAGSDLSPSNDISARFNTSVDDATCLGATSWYYGYDHNEGTNIDLLAVVLHELGHGLGFQTFTTLSTGAFSGGLRDIYAHFLFDDTQGLAWDQMTNAQRASSALNTNNLVWSGTAVYGHAYQFLGPRTFVRVDSPASFAGEKQFGTADFGVPLADPPVTGNVVLVNDGVGTTSDACETIVNVAALTGNIALIDRGTCPFADKATRAQAAGATAVIIANNVAGSAPGMTGSAPGLTIPVVSITQADATTMKSLLAGGVVVALGADNTRLAGTDVLGHPLMYAPNPLEPGSSVSHWDVSETPNLLMEPFINSDLTGVDLTRYVFEDLGWFPRLASVETPVASRTAFSAPNPFRMATAIRFQLARPGFTEVVVYDVRGAIVRRLLNAFHPAGSTSITWDGSDANGHRVPPGLYLYRVRSNDVTQTGRMTLMD